MKSVYVFCILMLLLSNVNAQVSLPSNQSSNNTGNLGLNQDFPTARLHISDDPEQLNCKAAILIESNLGSEASSGEGPSAPGTESSGDEGTCTTPFVFRNNTTSSGLTETNFNISPNGRTTIGSIFNLTGTSSTQLSIESNLGIYDPNFGRIKLETSNNTNTSSKPSLVWENNELTPFSFSYQQSSTILNPILSLSPENKVGINNENPQAALHIISNLESPNEGDADQIQGLLIENNGYRNHDFALEIRTGQRPAGAAMNNGRVFTVSNAGTVHIGPSLNWTIPYNPDGMFRLYVQDGIRTERVRIDIASENDWADYVFAPDYELQSSEELEAFIKEHKHLPGVPSAQEVVEQGVDLGEMNKILLEKIEELTLRVLELEKQVKNEG